MTRDSNAIWLLAGGYLWPPGYGPRCVQGIEQLALDMLYLGVTVRWGEPPDGKLACCYWWRGEIVLRPILVERDCDTIRDVIAHEVGHVVKGPSCSRARWWQHNRYRELLDAVPVAA